MPSALIVAFPRINKKGGNFYQEIFLPQNRLSRYLTKQGLYLYFMCQQIITGVMYIHTKQRYETKHGLFAKNIRLGSFLSLKLPASLQASYPEFQVTSRSVKQQEEVY